MIVLQYFSSTGRRPEKEHAHHQYNIAQSNYDYHVSLAFAELGSKLPSESKSFDCIQSELYHLQNFNIKFGKTMIM